MPLVVPGCLRENPHRLSHLAMCKQSDHREQSQQRRGGSPYRQLRPLSLGLESEMPAHLLKGHLKLPAHNKPADDLLWISVKVSTKESLGLELSLRITHQHPTNRHGEQARRILERCLRSDLDCAILAPVPVGNRDGFPEGGMIFGHLRKVGQAPALEARPPSLAWFAWGRRLVECGVQPKTAEEGDRVSQLAAAIKELQ